MIRVLDVLMQVITPTMPGDQRILMINTQPAGINLEAEWLTRIRKC